VTVQGGPAQGSGRQARLSVRVPPAVKTGVRAAVDELQARGLRTSESELVELFVSEGVAAEIDAVEQRLRRWRAAGGSER
jgi:hypothetical protein